MNCDFALRIRRLAGLSLALCVLFFGCRKPPPVPRATAPDPPLPGAIDARNFDIGMRSSIESLNRNRRPDWLAHRNDRRELVMPAPEGFVPEPFDEKVRLRLIIENPRIRRGGTLRYRLELQNVGRKPYFFSENPSLFKGAALFDEGFFKFIAVLPDGSTAFLRPEVKLTYGRPAEVRIPGQELFSAQQSSDVINGINAYGRAVKSLTVLLQPGETLYSRPWRDSDLVKEYLRTKGGEIPPNPEPLEFRPLKTEGGFEAPGRYSLKVRWALPEAGPLSKQFIEEMRRRGYSRDEVLDFHRRELEGRTAPFESESVQIEVGRW